MKSIFISSTFKDMHFERDVIHTNVLPTLNKLAAVYGESVSFCDLRWGVDTSHLESEDGSRKVLSVCLDEIEQSRPYMIVILGERYGWIPEKELIGEAWNARMQEALEDLEKSVTALEIEYGALNRKDRLDRVLFYFREIEGEVLPEYRAESELHAKKLAELKERIRDVAGDRLTTYRVQAKDGVPVQMEQFGELVLKDLTEMLTAEWEKYAQMDLWQRMMMIHTNHAEEKAAECSGRKELLHAVTYKLENSAPLISIQGTSGSGKSTFMSKLYDVLQKENNGRIVPIFCGYTTMAETMDDIVKIMVYNLEEILGKPHMQNGSDESENAAGEETVSESEEENSNSQIWMTRLKELHSEFSVDIHGRLIFLIDGADQLRKDELRRNGKLFRICRHSGIRMVVTSLPGTRLGIEPKFELIMPLMDDQERVNVVKEILKNQHRELDENVAWEIVKKGKSLSPLYLKLAVQRLLMMDQKDFEQIRAEGDDMNAITNHLMKLIAELPTDLGELSRQMVELAAERIGGKWCLACVDYLALSRRGLHLEDLEQLMKNAGQTWNALDFSRFVYYLNGMFYQRADGCYDFGHESFRRCFRTACQDQMELQKQMVKHLAANPKNPLSITELLYHCKMAGDKETALNFTSQVWKKRSYRGISMYQDSYTKIMMQNAARGAYLLYLEDKGEWLLSILKEFPQDERLSDLADFLLYPVCSCFENNREQSGLKHELLLELVKIYRAKKDNKGSLYDCCRKLLGSFSVQDGEHENEKRELAELIGALSGEIAAQHVKDETVNISWEQIEEMLQRFTDEDDKSGTEEILLDFLEQYLKETNSDLSREDVKNLIQKHGGLEGFLQAVQKTDPRLAEIIKKAESKVLSAMPETGKMLSPEEKEVIMKAAMKEFEQNVNSEAAIYADAEKKIEEAIGLMTRADADAEKGDPTLAISADSEYRKCLKLLLEADQVLDNCSTKGNLALLYEKMAHLYHKTGQQAELKKQAAEASENAVNFGRKYYESCDDKAEAARVLVRCQLTHCSCLEALGDEASLRQTENSYTEMIRELTRLIEQEDVQEYHSFRAEAELGLANMLGRLARYDKSKAYERIRIYRDAIRDYVYMAEKTDYQDYWENLIVTREAAIECLSRDLYIEECMTESLQLGNDNVNDAKKMVQRKPDHRTYECLARSYGNLAAVYLYRMNYKGASISDAEQGIEYLKKAIELLEQRKEQLLTGTAVKTLMNNYSNLANAYLLKSEHETGITKGIKKTADYAESWNTFVKLVNLGEDARTNSDRYGIVIGSPLFFEIVEIVAATLEVMSRHPQISKKTDLQKKLAQDAYGFYQGLYKATGNPKYSKYNFQ